MEQSDRNAAAILERTTRAMRRESLTEIEEVRRLLDHTNEDTRQIANAAVDFFVFGERPLNPAWLRSSTWAKVNRAFQEVAGR